MYIHPQPANSLIASKVARRSWDVEAWISIVRDLCAETVFPIGGVANDLQPPVRKLDSVLATDDVTVAYRVMGIIISKGFLFDRVVEIERHSWLVMVMIVLEFEDQ